MNKTIKKQLRSKYLKILKNLDTNTKKQWDEKIYQKFISSKQFQNYDVYAAYFPLSYEVNVSLIISFLLKKNKKIALPRIEDQSLEFYYIRDFSELVVDNKWGIYQPKKTNELAKIEDLQLIILPLVGFNDNYYRLGHGKGYYDRYLNNSNFKAVKLTLAYQIQKIATDIFFIDFWDIPFDTIITE